MVFWSFFLLFCSGPYLGKGSCPNPKIEKVSKLSALAFLSEMQLSRASKVICEVK